MVLTVSKLFEIKKALEETPGLCFNCAVCGIEYVVFGEVPDGGYIICDECSGSKLR